MQGSIHLALKYKHAGTKMWHFLQCQEARGREREREKKQSQRMKMPVSKDLLKQGSVYGSAEIPPGAFKLFLWTAMGQEGTWEKVTSVTRWELYTLLIQSTKWDAPSVAHLAPVGTSCAYNPASPTTSDFSGTSPFDHHKHP